MAYEVGIDLGTTYTAAAVHRDGRSSIFPLGSRAAAIPSVVYLKEGGEVLTGEAAVRRAITEPERVAREFKRRLGDTTPVIVGGTPYSAEALMARVLRAVLDQVESREGSAPSRVAISHPANWGQYKLDLLHQAVRLAEVEEDRVVLISEPEAAALSYASQERIEPGEVIAVYDLGGGTFDAAVLRRTEGSFEILGKPEGIERLGGIDFDAAVAAHVARCLDGALDDLDDDDPSSVAAMSRLRQDCVDAKEALSSDTDARIPVLLPALQTEVRITRAEFEALIRPSLVDSIGAMHRAVKSAGITLADVSKVLLVGGSSRVPLISQMVSSELGRPVAVDAHPKHAVALGAAVAASTRAPLAPTRTSEPEPAVPEPSSVPVAPVAPVDHGSPAAPIRPGTAGAPTERRPLDPPPMAPPAATPNRVETTPTPEPVAAVRQAPAEPPAPAQRPSRQSSPVVGPAPDDAPNRLPLIAALVAVLAVIGIGAFIVLNDGGDETAAATVSTDVPDSTVDSVDDSVVETTEASTTTEAATASPPPSAADVDSAVAAVVDEQFSTVEASIAGDVVTLVGRAFDDEEQAAAVAAVESLPGVGSVDDQTDVQAEDERCTEIVQSQPNWACVDSATWDGTNVTGTYYSSVDEGGPAFSINSGLHLHLYASSFDPTAVGTSGPFSDGSGNWQVWDTPQTITVTLAQLGVSEVPEKLCALIANQIHTIESLNSGTCWPIEDLAG